MAMEEAIAISFAIFSFVFAYMALNLDKRHSILGWFFLPLSVLMMVITTILFTEYETASNINDILSDVSFMFIIVIVLIIAYFLIFIIIQALGKLSGKEPYGDKLGG